MIRADDILALTRRQPFVPFRIHLSDGSSYLVSHPELALVSSRQVFVGVAPDGEAHRPPRDVHFCSILHITRLEQLVEN